MKQNLIESYVKKNDLLNITTVIHGSKKVLEVKEPVKVYDCVKYLDDKETDYVFIDNKSFRSRLVLLSNKAPILCLGYDEQGEIESIIPFKPTQNQGSNHRICTNRYILFMRLNIPSHAKELPPISDDQRKLNEFVESIYGKTPMTDELKNWWIDRY